MRSGTKLQTIDTRIGKIELENGYPSRESVSKLYDELDFQRAVQSYIWATPIMAFDSLRLGNERDLGIRTNELLMMSSYVTPDSVALTANNTTIYTMSVIDVSKGPIVIESPPQAYGVIDDYWQRPVVEIGPFGPDKGEGGKFLIVPPGDHCDAPPGFFTVASPTTRLVFLVRGFVHNGDVKAAVDLLRKVRIYPLAKAANPPTTRAVDGSGKKVDTIAPAGYEYWPQLAAILNVEPVEERDRFIHAMLKPLGIEKGKPFKPDARQRKLLTDAAVVGFRMAQTISMSPRFENAAGYPGTHWEWVLTLNPNQESENYSQLDERTDYTFEAITIAEGMVKPMVGSGSQYMSTARDKQGEWLDGGKSYRLRVPAKVPVKEFWAVTVYDNLTRSMIQTDTHRAGLSSQDELLTNADGSIDIFFSPKALPGHEKNWVKTLPGKGWFAYFRWYGPTETFFDKSWTLPDIQLAA